MRKKLKQLTSRLAKIPEITPWTAFIRSSMICAMLGAVTIGLAVKKIEPLPVSTAPLHFEADRAYEKMRQLAKGFPNRVTWSDSRRKAADWLRGEFQKLGYEPQGMRFSEVIAGKQYTGLENIYAEKKGTRHPDEIIVVMAHYDITDTTVEGAMDDASGVGVVLELARIFATEKTDRTVIFMATDSEEFGAFWGARAFARNFDRADKIVAAGSFDFVAPEKQTRILTLTDGLQHGYTPLWLRELALDSLRSVGGVEAADLYGVEEFIQRAVQIPPADHGAFLAAGIPAFNWVGQTDNFAHMMSHYHHTPNDVVEAIRPESFVPYGKSAERWLRSVDELPRIPADFRDYRYWKLTSGTYMEGWGVTLLHVLAFIPFLVYSITKFGRVLYRRPKARILGVIRNEAKAMGILLGSLLIGYAVMLLLPMASIVARYEIMPATQKSIFLYTPNFVAIALVLASVIGVYFIFKKTFAAPEDSIGHVEIRHAFHAAFLAILITIAVIQNSYLAALLLIPPAYFWTAMRARRQASGRVLNALFLLGGAITFVTVAIALSLIYHVGVLYWYIFLAATYGLISAAAVVAFLMAITVMIRLLRAFIL